MTESLQERQRASIRNDTGPERKRVQIREAIDARQWNDYLAEHKGSSLFHRAEWEQVFGVYGLKMIRLAAVCEGRVVGVLPLVWQRSLLFGTQLVSLPWFDAAGVLADDEEVTAALVEAAQKTARSRKGAVLQLRQRDAIDASTGWLGSSTDASPQDRRLGAPLRSDPSHPLDISLHVRTDKVLMRLRLERDPEALWKGFKANVRNQVRKAEKSGLTVSRGGKTALDDFYRVYSQNMRDLGSPPHGRSFFERVLQTFPCQSRLYTVSLEGQVIGAGLTMAGGNRLEIPWASSLRAYNRYCVNNLMYWRILEDACREGFEWFHFGRSTRDSGPYRFKKQWGAEPVQLHWYYAGDDERRLASLISPEESFGWGRRVWQRLPVPLSRLVGPRIISRVP